MQKRLTRAEVPVEETWNLTDLFPTGEAWEAELTGVEADIVTVAAYQGKLGEGADRLLACLDAQEALQARFVRVMTLASLRNSEDGTNPVNQGAMARVAGLAAKISAGFSFIRTEILGLPEGTVERYLQTEPGLVSHRYQLTEMLEYKPHTLTPETEMALASLGEVQGAPSMIYNRAKSSDMQFEPITDREGNSLPMSFALYEGMYEGSEDVEIRRRAFASFTRGLKNYQNTFAATFATEIKKNVVLARLRGYPSTTHMLLHPQKVTAESYSNILDILGTELAPHMRRYAQLRKRVLGLDKLLYCDIEAPLDPGFNPRMTYEEGSRLILEALSMLGPEYTRVMKNALTERWVDRADNVGKSTGAFCSSPYGAHPFILVTWNNTMRNVFVLAHELGHAGHFALAQRNQRLVNTRPSMFFIEAPSTMNELILGQHILANTADPRMKRWVIMSFLATYYHNYVRHLMEGELQRRIYAMAEAGRPITAQTLSQTKGEVLEQYWGDTVEIDDGARLTWMRQPHYYMGLYPYTYAAGLTASTAVAQLIQAEGEPAVLRWLEVLKAGGTMKPLELMKHAGVDMSSPDPIRKAVAYVGSLVDQLESSF